MRRENGRKRQQSSPARKQRSRRTLFHLVLLLFLAGSALIAADILRRNVIFFPLKDIEIIGNKHLSAEEIVSLSHVQKGAGILSFASRSLAANLRKSPWIKDVAIRKELPDRIIIRISEAVPVALFERNDGYYLIDSEGAFLEKQTSEEKFLPIVRGDAENRKALREAVRLAEVLREHKDFSTENPEIVFGNADDMTVRYGKSVIRMGYGGYREKLNRYLELQDEIVRRGIPVESVDLRYEKRVVVRAADGGSR